MKREGDNAESSIPACRLLKASQQDAGTSLTAQHVSDLNAALAAYLGDPSPDACFQASNLRLIRWVLLAVKQYVLTVWMASLFNTSECKQNATPARNVS